MKNINGKLSLIMCAMVASVQPALAEKAGTIYLNPAVGYHMFGSKSGVEDGAALVIGGEYVISPKFGAEVSYLYGNPDIDGSSGDVDNAQYTLDGLYYTSEIGNWQPFINAGIGHGTFDSGAYDTKETQLNVGVGSRYHFNDKWSARLQAKMINSLDDERWDSLITAGVSYAFGSKSKAPAVVVLQESESDGDGDAIFDKNDQCLNTPSGVYVDDSGCALDRDGDGIPDYLDQCPDSATTDSIDENGCVIVMEQPASMKLEVHFANNSAVIPETAKSKIKDLADLMTQFLNADVVIEGHSDSSGKAAYNKVLSQRRADAVRDILIREYGIDTSRVSAIGYGQEQPVASNSTKEGRLENRRVMAEISYK
ncbi:OmpA/MotB domain protein [Moritella viscosa]|uniref:OmpA/MotB domain protein n=1 Tax=Moritella viscosa TaxID=80854 RepID=A0A090KB71_9GAMM|nr:OmpA family protein [Moritella viscosa]CED61098.1 outer membrane protein [Moritella viscosa]SGZ18414.1 OmpA/MotB domain protein [Moritella viscosa]SHN99611.1 OmpA/MotB domain protein [Moritella viscosa]SHN99620.1 OmpA/MotB domain protein [Moritella viscosa]SHN99623.1 OmpA/MotB domain protein [Moritella viscosa]